MLKNIDGIYGQKLEASDGDLGHVRDFYFDDKTWKVRYIIVDTGSWLTSRTVMVSPQAFGNFDQDGGAFLVNLTRRQIEDSPSIESHLPVSEQYERAYSKYFGWAAYREECSTEDMPNYQADGSNSALENDDLNSKHKRTDDFRLRSTQVVASYDVQGIDGWIGRVSSFLLDIKTWTIREMIVESGHWFSKKKILVRPVFIDRISFTDSKVFVSLTMLEIQRTGENKEAKTAIFSH
jgi:uncharacterized protein YrrD